MTNPAADPDAPVASSSDGDPVAQARTLTQALQEVIRFVSEALFNAVAGHPETLTEWLSDLHKSSTDVSGHPLVVQVLRLLDKREDRLAAEDRTARVQAWEHLEKAMQIAVEGKKGGLEDATIIVILDRFLGDGKPQPGPLETIFEKIQAIVIQAAGNAAQARTGGCGCGAASHGVPTSPPDLPPFVPPPGPHLELHNVFGQIEYLWLRLDPAQQEELIASLKETFHYPADADATQPPAAG